MAERMKLKADVAVLYQDPDLLVVSKPSGLPTVPDGYDADSPYLAGLLEPSFGQLWVVHRLDRDTSGLVVLARSADTHRALNQQFQEHDVDKVYHALVLGDPVWNDRTVSAPLRIDADRQHRTIVDIESGKPSVTQFRVLERFAAPVVRYALIQAMPKTGRMHQIRVHLGTLGMAVAGDALYGQGEPIFLSAIKRRYRTGEEPEQPLMGRLGLHALRITIVHPATGEAHTFVAPYPKDFTATLNQLRKHTAWQQQPQPD